MEKIHRIQFDKSLVRIMKRVMSKKRDDDPRDFITTVTLYVYQSIFEYDALNLC